MKKPPAGTGGPERRRRTKLGESDVAFDVALEVVDHALEALGQGTGLLRPFSSRPHFLFDRAQGDLGHARSEMPPQSEQGGSHPAKVRWGMGKMSLVQQPSGVRNEFRIGVVDSCQPGMVLFFHGVTSIRLPGLQGAGQRVWGATRLREPQGSPWAGFFSTKPRLETSRLPVRSRGFQAGIGKRISPLYRSRAERFRWVVLRL